MDSYEDSFQHEALLYAGDDEFLAGTLPFAQGAIERDEQILIALGEAKTNLLRGALGRDAERAIFTPMETLGQNPARIIPAWRDFVAANAGADQPVRGIGEPIWPGRSADEVVECHHHEALLNYAFDDGPAWWLLCPYDRSGLEDEVLEAAEHTHPSLVSEGTRSASGVYEDPRRTFAPFDGPLSAPPARREERRFSSALELHDLRDYVTARATAAGLTDDRAYDLELSVNELATNSLRHGGGSGTLFTWREPDALVCEVRDAGTISWPLVGRERPLPERIGGRGVWIVNQLCDLVQIRGLPEGNVVRVRMGVG
jgi:anti-sigma regulatory factor (Ser/Thr protein kinase)